MSQKVSIDTDLAGPTPNMSDSHHYDETNMDANHPPIE